LQLPDDLFLPTQQHYLREMKTTILPLLLGMVVVAGDENFSMIYQPREDEILSTNLRGLHRLHHQVADSEDVQSRHYGNSNMNDRTRNTNNQVKDEFVSPFSQDEKNKARSKSHKKQNQEKKRNESSTQMQKNPSQHKLTIESLECHDFFSKVKSKVLEFMVFNEQELIDFFCSPNEMRRMLAVMKDLVKKAKTETETQTNPCFREFEALIVSSKKQVIGVLGDKKDCAKQVKRELAFVKL
jgi:hypothetical protein